MSVTNQRLNAFSEQSRRAIIRNGNFREHWDSSRSPSCWFFTWMAPGSCEADPCRKPTWPSVGYKLRPHLSMALQVRIRKCSPMIGQFRSHRRAKTGILYCHDGNPQPSPQVFLGGYGCGNTQMANPVATPRGGYYNARPNSVLTCSSAGSEIRYSVVALGAAPGTYSVYSAPISMPLNHTTRMPLTSWEVPDRRR